MWYVKKTQGNLGSSPVCDETRVDVSVLPFIPLLCHSHFANGPS
uniref:Uncharacterized protein n=1 Tax=Anguilla anguilla TaxID=7936 RepID=A0A0E9Q8T6_ANGAN